MPPGAAVLSEGATGQGSLFKFIHVSVRIQVLASCAEGSPTWQLVRQSESERARGRGRHQLDTVSVS